MKSFVVITIEASLSNPLLLRKIQEVSAHDPHVIEGSYFVDESKDIVSRQEAWLEDEIEIMKEAYQAVPDMRVTATEQRWAEHYPWEAPGIVCPKCGPGIEVSVADKTKPNEYRCLKGHSFKG